MKNSNDTTQMTDNRIQSLDEYKTSHPASPQKSEDTPMPKLKQTLGHTQATHDRTHKAPTMLGIKNLVKTYENGHRAVKDVSLDIAKGEFLVLVGPSGCGKSSILRSIAGLESISGGEIHLGGRRVDNEKPAQRDIAMVFQNYALYPHMTVYKNLAYGLKNRGVSQHVIEEKIEKVAKTLRIEEYLDRKPAISASVLLWGERLYATLNCSCLMSLCLT
ncbi:hypothetical protein VCRA213O314_810009 [Vibrio crassostreae]|nr:hypothetical protein VCRA213O314_810009 [Vibrio crassostreae]